MKSQAVADRPGLVQLDAPGDVWTRAEEGVRPGVDARMGERLEEASRRVEGAIRVVRVNAHEHEPRVSPRDLNGLGQPLDVGSGCFAQEIRRGTGDERVAEPRDLALSFGWRR